MKDRWINAGFEDDDLKPYVEPELDITDQKRIGTPPKKFFCLLMTDKSTKCHIVKWN